MGIHGYRVDPIRRDGYTDRERQQEDMQWEAALESARLLSGELTEAGDLMYERVEVFDYEFSLIMATFMHGDRIVADYRRRADG